MKKHLSTFILVLLAVLLLSGQAFAASYSVSLDQDCYAYGEQIFVSGNAPANSSFALEILTGDAIVARLPLTSTAAGHYAIDFAVSSVWQVGQTYRVHVGKGSDFAIASFQVVVHVDSVTITNQEAFLGKSVGDAALKLEYQINPGNATNQTVSFNSSNQNVARVNSEGLVQFLKAGETIISVQTANEKSDSFQLTVYEKDTQAVPVTSVIINNKSAFSGKKTGDAAIAISYTVLPANATTQNVTFESSNAAVAAVNANGLVSFLAAGETIITVKTANGKSDSFKLSVAGGGGGGGVTGGSSGGPTKEIEQPQQEATAEAAKEIKPEAVPLANAVGFAGFINGFEDNTFRPEAEITREQFIRILYMLKAGPAYPKADTANPSYPDVPATRWSYHEIEWAKAQGIIEAGADFRPGEPLLRAEMAVMLAKCESLTEPAANTFSDLAEHQNRDDILRVVQAGILNGYPDGSFQPDGHTKRSEAVKALVVYLAAAEPTAAMVEGLSLSFTDIPQNYWAYRHILLAVNGYTKP